MTTDPINSFLTSSTYPSTLRIAMIAAPARKLALAWLFIGVTALVIATLFSLLTIAARIPGFENIFTTANFFLNISLVNFDQSVLIWFLTFGGVLWGLGESKITFLHRLALVFMTLGCLAIGIAPFAGFSKSFVNNYVPILLHPLFMGGILLCGMGICFQVLLTMRQIAMPTTWTRPDRLAALTAAFATLAAFLALAWTWLQLTGWSGQEYFDLLFWSSGHTLQFAYTQLMLVAWLGLAAGLGITLRISIRVLQGLLILGVLPIFFVPVHYAHYAIDSPEFHHAFVTLMRHGAGLAAIPIGIIIFYGLLQRRNEISSEEQPLYAALIASLFLFSIGGILGWMSTVINNIISAHHHSFIGGVTVALMGLTYHLLPPLGFPPSTSRLTAIQPWLYAAGQLLQIVGIAAAGVMGIQHPMMSITPESNQLGAQVALGIIDVGSMLTAISVILFVAAVVDALRHPRAPRW